MPNYCKSGTFLIDAKKWIDINGHGNSTKFELLKGKKKMNESVMI